MTTLGIIPARGGSKGVPGKNVRMLGGMPLIAHTILAAKASRKLDHFLVSTDDDQIAAVSRDYGADVLRRPVALAQDDSPVDDAVRHVLASVPCDFTTVALLQPTTPLRLAEDIDIAISLFEGGGADTVIGVTEVGDSHPARMYRIAGDVMIPLAAEGGSRLRQQLEPIFIRNGAIYIAPAARLRQGGSLFGAVLRGYVMPAERSANIDHEVDFAIAEYYWAQRASREAK